MKFDRGFIKWQPFNSLTPSKTVINNLKENQKEIKPILYEEEIMRLSEEITDAYYSQNKIKITFYEHNKIQTMETIITKIDKASNTINLDNHKTISFKSLINIENT